MSSVYYVSSADWWSLVLLQTSPKYVLRQKLCSDSNDALESISLLIGALYDDAEDDNLFWNTDFNFTDEADTWGNHTIVRIALCREARDFSQADSFFEIILMSPSKRSSLFQYSSSDSSSVTVVALVCFLVADNSMSSKFHNSGATSFICSAIFSILNSSICWAVIWEAPNCHLFPSRMSCWILSLYLPLTVSNAHSRSLISIESELIDWVRADTYEDVCMKYQQTLICLWCYKPRDLC